MIEWQLTGGGSEGIYAFSKFLRMVIGDDGVPIGKENRVKFINDAIKEYRATYSEVYWDDDYFVQNQLHRAMIEFESEEDEIMFRLRFF